MKKPIIEIKRADETMVKALIEAGILEVREDGLHVAEKE